jgi:hypothetical protein
VSNFPTNEAEFHARLGDEESCLSYLIQTRWPDGFICPRCSHRGGYELKRTTSATRADKREMRECAKCKYQCSVRAGTVMEGSKKPLSMWFAAIYYMIESKQGFSALGLMRRLGLGSYQTAWTWYHKLRELLPKDTSPIYGRVEVDEFYIGGKSVGTNIRGRGSPKKVMVAVAVECKGRGSGRVVFKVMKTGAARALGSFIKEVVGTGSTIQTDANKAYDSLAANGFVHDKVESEDEEAVSRHLPRVYRITGLVKRVLNGTHMGAVAPWRLQKYLDEYAFRFERKKAPIRFALFIDLLTSCLTTPCRTYRQIADDATDAAGGYSKKAKRPRGRNLPKKSAKWWRELVTPTGWPSPSEVFGG